MILMTGPKQCNTKAWMMGIGNSERQSGLGKMENDEFTAIPYFVIENKTKVFAALQANFSRGHSQDNPKR